MPATPIWVFLMRIIEQILSKYEKNPFKPDQPGLKGDKVGRLTLFFFCFTMNRTQKMSKFRGNFIVQSPPKRVIAISRSVFSSACKYSPRQSGLL